MKRLRNEEREAQLSEVKSQLEEELAVSAPAGDRFPLASRTGSRRSSETQLRTPLQPRRQRSAPLLWGWEVGAAQHAATQMGGEAAPYVRKWCEHVSSALPCARARDRKLLRGTLTKLIDTSVELVQVQMTG